jgi:subtilisin family serine protease
MPFKNKFILSFNILFLILLSEYSVAQNKFWVEVSKEYQAQVNERGNDVNTLFSKLITSEGAEIIYYSSFVNAYSIYFPQAPSIKFKRNDLIRSVQQINYLQVQQLLPNTAVEYGFALEQIKGHFLSETLDLTGKGVKIGVIDGGFLGADKDPSLFHLIKNDQILYFSDYLMKNNTDPFYGKRFAQDEHGTEVLRMIGGSNLNINIQTGLAIASDYYLARTDHGIRENRIEEDYWIMALESFYEMGIKLVNSSLGYTDSFDRKKENHHKSEVDGKSSMITKAAEAAAQKGMLLIIAAGNDGGNKWETLSLPADAEHVLTVGATDLAEWAKMGYSSIGNGKLGYIKPDVVCFAGNGTSYAAPIITGLAACIWQFDSTLSNLEIIDLIQSASHLADVPNNYLGYGVPNAQKIVQELKGNPSNSTTEKRQVSANVLDLTTEDIMRLVYYHKSRNQIVQSSGVMRRGNKEASFIIERPKGTNFTTISYKDQFLLEIEWTK